MEFFENPLALIRRDSGPAIRHANTCTSLRFSFGTYQHLSAGTRVLHRVVHEVQHDLLQRIAISREVHL